MRPRLPISNLNSCWLLFSAALLLLDNAVVFAQEPQSAPSAVRSRQELNRPETEPKAPTVRHLLPVPPTVYSVPPTAALAAQSQPADPRKPIAGVNLAVDPEAQRSGVCQ